MIWALFAALLFGLVVLVLLVVLWFYIFVFILFIVFMEVLLTFYFLWSPPVLSLPTIFPEYLPLIPYLHLLDYPPLLWSVGRFSF